MWCIFFTSAGLSAVMVGDVAPETPLPQPMDNGSTSTVLHISWEPITLDFSPVFYVLQYYLRKPNGITVFGAITVRSFLFLTVPPVSFSAVQWVSIKF